MQDNNVDEYTDTLPKDILTEMTNQTRMPTPYPLLLSDDHLYFQQYK